MKKQRKLYLAVFCLCMACFSSCNEEKMSEQPAGETAAVEEIKNLIDLSNLSLPDVTKNGDKETRNTKHLYYTPNAVVPIWNSYQMCTEGDATIWMFQLKASETLSGMIQSYYYGKKENQTANAIFKLAVRQKNGKTTSRIITYIPDESYLQKEGIRADQLGYNLKDIHYSGKVIISTLDGKIIFGEKYENGNITYKFCPENNVLYNSTNKKKCETEKTKEFYLSFNLFAQGNKNLLQNNYMICPTCGNPISECGCMVLLKIQNKATRSDKDKDKNNGKVNRPDNDWWILVMMENPLLLEEETPL